MDTRKSTFIQELSRISDVNLSILPMHTKELYANPVLCYHVFMIMHSSGMVEVSVGDTTISAKDLLVAVVASRPDYFMPYYFMAVYLAKDSFRSNITKIQQSLITSLSYNEMFAKTWHLMSKTIFDWHSVVIVNGKEYTKRDLLLEGFRHCDTDPAILNDVGVMLHQTGSGGIKLSNGQFLTATGVFVRALSISPRVGRIYYNLGYHIDRDETVNLYDTENVCKKDLLRYAILYEPKFAPAYVALACIMEKDDKIQLTGDIYHTADDLIKLSFLCSLPPDMPIAPSLPGSDSESLFVSFSTLTL